MIYLTTDLMMENTLNETFFLLEIVCLYIPIYAYYPISQDMVTC